MTNYPRPQTMHSRVSIISSQIQQEKQPNCSTNHPNLTTSFHMNLSERQSQHQSNHPVTPVSLIRVFSSMSEERFLTILQCKSSTCYYRYPSLCSHAAVQCMEASRSSCMHVCTCLFSPCLSVTMSCTNLSDISVYGPGWTAVHMGRGSDVHRYSLPSLTDVRYGMFM